MDKLLPTSKGGEMARSNLRAKYNFNELGKPVRGKYAEAYKRSANLVLLDEDVARAFPNEKAANDALRLLMTLANRVTPPKPN